MAKTYTVTRTVIVNGTMQATSTSVGTFPTRTAANAYRATWIAKDSANAMEGWHLVSQSHSTVVFKLDGQRARVEFDVLHTPMAALVIALPVR